MATYTKRGSRWRAQVRIKGVSDSESFSTKAEATTWATAREHELNTKKRGGFANKTLGDVLDEYARKVTPHKRGQRWELVRIEKLKRDKIAKVKLADLDASHFADWRDRMLEVMSAASVRREWNVINPALNIAVKEWRWLPENPMKEVRRPKPGKARDRRPSADETERLLYALGYQYDERPETDTARVGAAYLFAIETAMRAGEICSLTVAGLDLKHQTAHLPKTKNGDARTVPLSTEAIRIIKQLKPHGKLVFDLTTASIDALFRKAKGRALIDDLHFHDTRHEAITRLSKKLTVLELARMVGIKDLRILMVYYNETAAELAKKLG